MIERPPDADEEKNMKLQPGQSIYDPCFTCGHLRVSHMSPITNKPSACRRCHLKTDSTPEENEKEQRHHGVRDIIASNLRPRSPGQTEDRGIACHAFKEKPENQQ